MLIRFCEQEPVSNFAQLYWQTTLLLIPYRRERKTAVVFGPISDADPARVKQNVLVLRKKARELSSQGLNVLDISSYQKVITRVTTKRGVVGYPHEVLEEFTLPLISNGWFNIIHFRQPFSESVGTLREYQAAQQTRRLHDIQIIGFY